MSPANTGLRIAVIGAGIAGLHHARAAVALGHRVTKASTRSESSKRWAAFCAAVPGVTFEREAERLLHDPDVDAVVAALPWNVMPDWLDRLLACRKPALMEKPIALSAATIEAALARPGVLPANKLVGFNRRFYGTVARLRARLAQGGLKAAYVVISEAIDRHIKNHGPAIAPHVLTFASSHALDLALHLLGPLTVVRMYRFRERDSAFVSLNGLAETAGGIPVSLAINAGDPVAAGLRLLFDDHTSWVLSPLETLTVFDRYDVSETTAGSAIRRYHPHASEKLEEPAHAKPGFVEQMSVFLSGEYGPGARVSDALAVQKFIEACAGTVRS